MGAPADPSLPKEGSFRKVRKVADGRKRVRSWVPCRKRSRVKPKPLKRASPAPGAASHLLAHLRVGALPGERFRGRLIAGTNVLPCVLGPGGITRRKREGDGATPAGRFALVRLLFRPDRGPPPRAALPRRALLPRDGWCDDPRSARYNKPVVLSFPAGHERMWRDDHLYDAVVVIDYNLRPAHRGGGSAIFMHVQASPDRPTAGCVALKADALRRLLGRLGPRTMIEIG